LGRFGPIHQGTEGWPSPEGQRLVNKLLINGPAVSRETMKPLTVQEQRQLLELLSKIV